MSVTVATACFAHTNHNPLHSNYSKEFHYASDLPRISTCKLIYRHAINYALTVQVSESEISETVEAGGRGWVY